MDLSFAFGDSGVLHGAWVKPSILALVLFRGAKAMEGLFSRRSPRRAEATATPQRNPESAAEGSRDSALSLKDPSSRRPWLGDAKNPAGDETEGELVLATPKLVRRRKTLLRGEDGRASPQRLRSDDAEEVANPHCERRALLKRAAQRVEGGEASRREERSLHSTTEALLRRFDMEALVLSPQNPSLPSAGCLGQLCCESLWPSPDSVADFRFHSTAPVWGFRACKGGVAPETWV